MQRLHREKNYSEKAKALMITFEAEKVKYGSQKANSEAEQVKSDAEKAK